MEMLGWFSVNIQGAQLLQCGDSNEFCPREIKENRSSKTEGISGEKKKCLWEWGGLEKFVVENVQEPSYSGLSHSNFRGMNFCRRK